MAQTIEYLQGTTVPPGTYYLGCLGDLLGERMDEFYKAKNGNGPMNGKCRVKFDTEKPTGSCVVLNLCSSSSFYIESPAGIVPFNSNTSIIALVEADLVEPTPELEAQKFIFTEEVIITLSHDDRLVMSISSGDESVQVFEDEGTTTLRRRTA